MPRDLEVTSPSDMDLAKVQAAATVERVGFVTDTWLQLCLMFWRSFSVGSNIYHLGCLHIADSPSWHSRSTAFRASVE